MRKFALALALTAASLLAGATSATAAPLPAVVTFSASAAEYPEAIAFDKRGNLYVSFPFLGQVWKVAPDGSRSLLAALSPPGQLVYDLDNLSVTGLAVDAQGTVYAGVAAANPATRGVWRIGRSSAPERIPGSDEMLLPNGLAFGDAGDLYVTDSIGGAVWRIPRGGGAELWFQHELLEGTGLFGLPFPIGANGIAYRHGSLYVSNTEQGRIVRIPIGRAGAPGPAELVFESFALLGADGIALDVHGNVYAGVNAQNTIVRIAPDGSGATTVATAADGLDFPSSLAFGTGRGDRKTMFVTRYAVGPFFGLPASTPAVLALDLGVPGMPLP